ncbi:hypothetical protein Tco_1085331 [Tanacetum coccineum]
MMKTIETEIGYNPDIDGDDQEEGRGLSGSLPNAKQKNIAFGAAASMVHPATGFHIWESLNKPLELLLDLERRIGPKDLFISCYDSVIPS